MDQFSTLPEEMLISIMEHMSDKDIDSLAATSKRMHKLAQGPLRKAKLRYFYSKGLTDDMLEFLTGVSSKDARAQVGSIEYKEHFRPSDGVLIRQEWWKEDRLIRATLNETTGRMSFSRRWLATF